MSLRRFCTTALLALLSIAFVRPAAADTVNLKYLGVQNQRTYFSISGINKYKELMSDSFDNKVYTGQSWSASAMPLLTGIAKGMFGPGMSLDYKAAGLIYRRMLSNKLTVAQAQWAIWGLFSTNAQNTKEYSAFGGATIDATFLALAKTAPTKDYNGLFLYTPLGAKPGSGLMEFIGYNCSTVPEPGSLTLLGTGLLGLALAIRFKVAKS